MAMLVVSELVTNVVVHAHTPATVSLHLRQAQLRIEVSDSAQEAVQPGHERDGDRPGGWGLPLVESVARTWGVDPSCGDAGKTVWAELDVDRASTGTTSAAHG
jgi:anti-sigma regulatory factor (Ser/Thr protein kinase)